MISRRQGGAFTFRQAVGTGFSSSTIARRIQSGQWLRLYPGVYVSSTTPPSSDLALWAAVLAVGQEATLTHESAALLHGAERLSDELITLTAPHGSHHRLPGVMVHQIDDLVTRHRTTVRGLPVSSAARVVVELGSRLGVQAVGTVADDLVRSHRTTYSAIAAVLAELARPGKPGIETVVRMLEERGDGYVPPASELERSLFDTLRAGGLPEPERQVPLPGRGPLVGVVDGAYTDALMVLEADGRRWHTRMEASKRDRARDAQVVRAGWVPLRFVHEQIVHEPEEVCAVVQDTRARRLALLGRVA